MSNGKCKPPKEILPRESYCYSSILDYFIAYINKSSPIDVKITERIHLISIGVNHSNLVGVNHSISVGTNHSISIGVNHSISVGVNDSLMKILLIMTLIVILIV